MKVSLRSIGGPPGRVWMLQGGANHVGRHPQGEGTPIVLPADKIPQGPSISRQHVQIDVASGRVTLRRNEGANAVGVNDRPVEEGGQIDLHDGDRLLLGRALFEIQVKAEDGEALLPPVGRTLRGSRDDGGSETDLLRKTLRLEDVLEAARRILQEESFETALESMLREVIRAFGFQCGVVADLEQPGGRVRGRAFHGLDRFEDLSNVSQTIIRRALESGQPFLTVDARSDPRIGGEEGESIARYEIRQAMCAPLLSGKNRLGVIYLDRRTDDAAGPLSPGDEKVLARLAEIVTGALASLRDRQIAELRALLEGAGLVGGSETMLRLGARLRKAVEALDRNPRAPVLILGPQGSGKELVARAVRGGLARREKPYLGINMGGFAANPELAHSALFGHRKGAFSQAIEDRPGALGVVDGGVLFLDEIGDMPRSVQRLLKEFLAEETYGSYSRLGEEEKKRQADVVIIMATNRDLEGLAAKGEFESDLLRRLTSGHVIRVPSLDEHREDIPEIVSHYLDLFNGQYARHVSLSPEAVRILQEAPCDYNVSGLRAAVHAIVSQAEDSQPITLGRGPVERAITGLRERRSSAAVEPSDRPLREVELDHCLSVWERCARSYRVASEKLEVAENTLRKRLLEGQLRRMDGDLPRVAAFFGKTPAALEEEMATYKVARK